MELDPVRVYLSASRDYLPSLLSNKKAPMFYSVPTHTAASSVTTVTIGRLFTLLLLALALALSAGGCDTLRNLVTRPIEPGPDPDDVRITGDKLTVDDHILFVTDSAEIRTDSDLLLDRIARLLINHSEIKVVHVVGHTDAQGEAAYNQELSESRATAVVEALQARGVTQILDSRGEGESQLLCQEDSVECHQRNRRVEFFIEQD